MLEPLIVLTVLNCLFMFSSTMTTCALWWQYRTHRCCFRRDPANQAAKHAQSKQKAPYAKVSKRVEKPKHENGNEKGSVNDSVNSSVNGSANGNGNNRDRSNSVAHREGKSRRNSKLNTRSNSKNWFRNKSHSADPASSLSETLEIWEIQENDRMSEGAGRMSEDAGRMSEDTGRMSEETAKMSEASQTGTEAKSAVVMEYSTVQKIVQILDDTSDLDATRIAIRDFNARHNPERKIQELNIEPRNEPRSPICTTLPQT
ncbi:uncharacterized protein LOC117229183 [Megalopta genalis]|uniref:uncharacterized protein LOC117229183 n=1 Tax=Megalopta genalis TaxID=115081 RepID=UPI003FD04480